MKEMVHMKEVTANSLGNDEQLEHIKNRVSLYKRKTFMHAINESNENDPRKEGQADVLTQISK